MESAFKVHGVLEEKKVQKEILDLLVDLKVTQVLLLQ